MREITSHRVNPANDTIKIEVLDEPGDGGANHVYRCTWTWSAPDGSRGQAGTVTISLQNGPIGEVGVNGLTHEVLYAILIDRLEGFQRGKFANPFNQAALEHTRAAQTMLLERTRSRMARGVEGTHEV